MNGDGNGNNGGRSWSWWQVGAAAAGVAAAAGGVYMMTKNSSPALEEGPRSDEQSKESSGQRSVLSRLGDLLEPLAGAPTKMEDVVPQGSVPRSPNITNLNSLLADIYVRHIALKEEDFKLHYRVFTEVFAKVQSKMKEVDRYYERYSSGKLFAGSHYDRLRIVKPDEFDVDIVIDLPVNFKRDPFSPEESDIVIEQKSPGYVQLRAGVQYQKLLVRDGVDACINRTAHEWLDERHYILRSKFTNWFKSVGAKALNRFPRNGHLPACFVDGVLYTIRTSESGPAWTLLIEAPGFKLDVDLVPALRFPEDRWPAGRAYRPIPPECRRDYWMVVPKPRAGAAPHDEQRSWRAALQDQEKQFLNNTHQLRQTIRFMKKLRDAQNMNKIASYYIKTLFFWEYTELKAINGNDMWEKRDLATLFKHMLEKFHAALDKREILYFWNKQQNLIENVNQSLINEYKYKVAKLISAMDNPANYREVAKYLLTASEYEQYKRFLF